MKRIAIFVAMLALIAACNPYGSEVPRRMVGNYVSPWDGEWKCGFYEEFAIYQNDFWDYKTVSDSEIVLTKNSGETAVLKTEAIKFVKTIDGVEENFPALVVNGDTVVNYNNPSMFFAHGISPYYKNLFPGIKPDSSRFKKHDYTIGTAVVRLYLRNTAQGLMALGKRSVNRRKSIQVFNYLETKKVTAFPLDSTDHYGYRYEFEIPVTGVSEIPMANIFDHYSRGWNSEAGKKINYVIEPGDTLMFYCFEDDIALSGVNAYGYTECSGGSWRFNAEKNATLSLQDMSAHWETTYEDGTKESFDRNRLYAESEMLFSDKFKEMWRLKYGVGDSAVFDEEEIFKSVTAFDRVSGYIMSNADSLPSTAENLSLHPDWIVCENDSVNKIINPESIKKLGLSDDFIEFYRLMQAVQFYDDFSPETPMQDFEKQSIMRNITKADYKRYLEDKMKKVTE